MTNIVLPIILLLFFYRKEIIFFLQFCCTSNNNAVPPAHLQIEMMVQQLVFNTYLNYFGTQKVATKKK